jgi:hypothetical protein
MAVIATRGGCDDDTWRVHGQSVTAMVEVPWMANGLAPDRDGAEIPADRVLLVPARGWPAHEMRGMLWAWIAAYHIILHLER